MSADFFNYSDEPASPAPSARARLDSLTDEDWDHVVAHAARRRYAAGATLLAARTGERAIYIVADGKARADGAELVAGDVFGFEALFSGEAPRGAVVADTSVEVLMFTAEAFEQFAAWRPRVAILILRDLAGHLARRLAKFETAL